MYKPSTFLAVALLSSIISAGAVNTASAQIVIINPAYEKYQQDLAKCDQKRVDDSNACTANKSLTKEQYKECLAKADAEHKKCRDFARYMFELK